MPHGGGFHGGGFHGGGFHGGGFHGGGIGFNAGFHGHHHHHGGFYPGFGMGRGFGIAGAALYPVVISATSNSAPHVDVYVQPPQLVAVPAQGPQYAQASYPRSNGTPNAAEYPQATLSTGYQPISAARSLPGTPNMSPSSSPKLLKTSSPLPNKSNSSEMLYNPNSNLMPQPVYNPNSTSRPPIYTSNSLAPPAAFNPSNLSYASAPPMDDTVESYGPLPTYNQVMEQQQSTIITKM